MVSLGSDVLFKSLTKERGLAMLDTAIVGKVAGIVSLVAFIPYLIAMLRGKTKPNRATWLIWTVVGFMLLVSYRFSGANDTIWVPISYVIGPLVVFTLSIYYGKGGWNRFDGCCLFGSGASLFFWWMSGSPMVALLINLFIDFLGAIPTVRKVYHQPETEDRFAWVLACMSSIINLFAIEDWTFAIWVYPVYMCIGNGLITALIFIRRKQGAKAE